MVGECITSRKVGTQVNKSVKMAFDHIDANYGLPIYQSVGIGVLELSVAPSTGIFVTSFVNSGTAQSRGDFAFTGDPRS